MLGMNDEEVKNTEDSSIAAGDGNENGNDDGVDNGEDNDNQITMVHT